VARADDLLGSIGSAATGRVLVLHLEHEIDDVDWNRRKLALLEELLIRRGVAVDIVSEVDVLGYFSRRIQSVWDRADDSYVSPREMERWAQVLARLDKQRADLPPPPLPRGDRRRAALSHPSGHLHRWVALLTAVTTLGGGMTQLLGLFQTQRRQGTS
jgi:hypothetical protein